MIFNSTTFNLTNWRLTLPVDSSGNIENAAAEVRTLAGYSSDYFFAGSDGAMVFIADVAGATTSGTKYARSELREVNGPQRAAWTLSEGGVMTATLSVNSVPTLNDGMPGKQVIGQIHGESDELVRLYFDNGKVYFVNDQAGEKNTEVKFQLYNAKGETPSVDLGEKFSYKIDARGDTLVVTVYADGDTYSSTTKINAVWQNDTFYFKAGVYLGVNETQGSGHGEAAFYGLDMSHVAGQGLNGLIDATLPRVMVNLTGTGDADVLRGGNLDDMLSGGAGADILNGNGGADRLYGGAGADRLYGGAGIDYMAGGDGDDFYLVDDARDVIVEAYRGGLGGVDSVSSTVSFTLAQCLENLTLLGNSDINAFGNNSANILTGNSGDNVLDGGAGADTMVGKAGDDTYYVSTKSDVVVEKVNEGVDLVVASATYTLTDNVENLTLAGYATGGTGNAISNTIIGNAQNNTLYGLGGNDVLDGGAGADRLLGGAGNDTFLIDNIGDRVTELANEGRDVVKSSIDFQLGANVEELYLLAGAVTGRGNELANTIVGNDAANTISGGLGADMLKGGAGADKFLFDSEIAGGKNVDTVMDFRPGQDQVVLENLVFKAFGSGALAATAFTVGASAANASQHLIYNQAQGDLYYDADGAGGASQVLFAHFDNAPVLTFSSFLVV